MSKQDRLLREIEEKKTEFKTDSYPMSIGELINLHKNDELLINPDFQRYFRWSNTQKTKLIESILLGIPIPSIFVFQREDGIWEVVDGLQRISTLLQFMSELPEVEDVPKKDRLVLEGTKYLPHLEGMVWEKKNDDDIELPSPLKLHIKRSKLNLSIILSDSGPNAKFDVFQRLNTGGSYASDQEVRNSVMIMIKKDTFTWFKKLSNNEDFKNTISLSERLYDEQYPMELVLRFIALTEYDYTTKKELSDFFDEIVETILEDQQFDYQGIESRFNNVFEAINNVLGEDAFKRYDGTKFKGKFLESAFEAVTVGLSENYSKYTFPADNEIFKEKVQELHNEATFQRYTGSGSNARTRIPKIIPFTKDHFDK
ncbi:DUF262 domain-containing protein [Christiangramia fulva]|uniref:DUF262 domain-containing protein n=1 Tax=Christiangramia fulva TaxID=2126553 RepID=A0A2R3Z949_9FLAO|nr:DUF262 domain-containing protein [Christiangramia fulva]AVR46786.1 DUF262 domain-containing protein [Christiangramia fulva]